MWQTYHSDHLTPEIDDGPDIGVDREEDKPTGDASPDGQVGELKRKSN